MRRRRRFAAVVRAKPRYFQPAQNCQAQRVCLEPIWYRSRLVLVAAFQVAPRRMPARHLCRSPAPLAERMAGLEALRHGWARTILRPWWA